MEGTDPGRPHLVQRMAGRPIALHIAQGDAVVRGLVLADDLGCLLGQSGLRLSCKAPTPRIMKPSAHTQYPTCGHHHSMAPLTGRQRVQVAMLHE